MAAGVLDYAAYVGPPQPFRLFRVGGSMCFLRSAAAGKIVWSDLTTDTVAANQGVPYHDGTVTISNATAVYIAVAVKGGGLSLWLESDQPNFATLLPDCTYAVLFRVVDRVEYYQQT